MLSQTEEIKARVDLVDLIQEYIKLTPAGVDNFKALCPFHNEKTASFMVSKDKQIWHCFGCSEGGDIFTWLEKTEGMDFPEALRVLAKKANVKLEYHQPESSNEKTKLLDVCKQTTDYWHDLLLKDKQAEFVRDYLSERGLQKETILEWQLGWAKDSWDDLMNHLKELGYSEKEIFNAGLIVKSDQGKGYYDRFRNRLIFPINNHHGQVVGFTGRTMADEDAKYINSPQTLIYSKSYILYGIAKAKSYIRKQDYAILVEGNTDVIAVSQAGTKNVVGISGTALTIEQINILKRYSNNVMIGFDADSAGQKATLRGLDLAWQQGMNVKIIKLKAGKDPDACIKEDKQLWLDSIKEAINIIDYYFEIILKDLDLSRSDHKKKAAIGLLPIIAKLPDVIDRSHYIQKLAARLAVSDKILEDKINSLRSKGKRGQPQIKEPVIKRQDTVEMLSERILAILLSYPKKISLIINELLPEDFKEKAFQEIYKELVIYYNKDSFSDLDRQEAQKKVGELFKDKSDLLEQVSRLELLANKDFYSLTDHEIERELEQLTKRFKKESKVATLRSLSDELKEAEAVGKNEVVNELLVKINKLNQEINSLSI